MRPVKTIISWLAVMLSLISSATLVLPTAANTTDKSNPKTTPALEDSTAGIGDWLVVPVFYATNRAYAGESSNIQTYSEEPSQKGLLFGVKNIAAPMPSNSPVSKDTQEKMLWQHIRTERKAQANPPDFDKNKCGIKDALLSRDEIVPTFDAYMQNTDTREVVIFVHGCCANFDTSMERAAKIAAHMQVPVLLYDWVSPKGFNRYLENETRVQQTIDDFCKFLAKADKVLNPININLIGHSMGAQFLDGAMVRRAVQMSQNPSMPLYKELIMSNADVDARSFVNHAREFTSNAKKTRVYFSQKDDRLNASSIAHGGFTRLGSPGILLADLANSNTAEFIDITANNSGHELPFWVVANLHRYNELGPANGFQLKEIGPDLFLLTRNIIASQELRKDLAECACNNKYE